MLMGDSVKKLEPIASHCLFPSNKQSYSYGYHRGLKGHHEVLQLVAKEFLTNHLDAQMWALIGANDSDGKWIRRKTFTTSQLERRYRRREGLQRIQLLDMSTKYALSLIHNPAKN